MRFLINDKNMSTLLQFIGKQCILNENLLQYLETKDEFWLQACKDKLNEISRLEFENY